MAEFFLVALDAARTQGVWSAVNVWISAAADIIAGRVVSRDDVRAADDRLSIRETIRRDVRFAIRGYARSPRFTLIVILTLAIAIGATSSIFAVVNAVVLRPLPYPQSERLILVAQQKSGEAELLSVSPPNYFDLTASARSLAAFVAYGSGTNTLQPEGGTPERVRTTVVTAGFGATIGVAPVIGRLFNDADDQPGAARVLVLSHRLWQRNFGSDPFVCGRVVSIDDAPATIVGVMPSEFSFPGDVTDAWLPMRLSRTTPANPGVPPANYRQYRVLSVAARLKPGVSIAAARAELSGIGRALAADFPAANRNMTIVASPLKEATVGTVRRAMLLFLGAVVCLLLVACANVATLLAVRTASRQREIALCLALGSTRGNVVRQLLVESAVLAVSGGVAGIGAAFAFLRALIAIAPAGIPRLAGASIDGVVVAATFGVATVCGLAVGIVPVWQTSRTRLTAQLKTGGRSSDAPAHQRLRKMLIVAEVALSMLLLATAGLLIQTTRALGHVERGFDDAGVFAIDRIELPMRTPPASTASFYSRVEQAVRSSPGVTSAGLTLAVPLDPKGHFFIDDTPFAIDDRAPNGDAVRTEARIQVVSGGFFSALRIPLIAGRLFDDHDGPGAPAVVMINQALAQRYFPKGDAVGQWITHELSIVPDQALHRQIVGIVGDVRQFNLDEAFEPELFVPHAQMPWPAMALVVQSPLGADQTAAAVRSAVWSLDPKLPVPQAVPVADVLSEALGQPRLRATLLTVFASAALALAAMGLYGVITFGVEQRRRELAIRLMLGATAGRTRGLVMVDGLRLAAAGAILGLGGSIWLGRSLSSLLFGVGASDTVTIVWMAMLLFLVTAAACFMATRRITRIDPIRAMTSD